MGKVSIVNEGEKFDKNRYGFLLGDIDGDGNPNVDDKYPYDKTKTGYVEASPLSESITKLIDLKSDLDETMYDTVDKIVEFSPNSDVYARTKTPFSIINKLVKKRLLDTNKGLTDLVGTTIAVDDYYELLRVRDKIRDGDLGVVLEEENFYDNPKDGYQAIHYILIIDGNQVEVQLKTKRTKDINAISHKAYKSGKLNVDNLENLMQLVNLADKGEDSAIIQYNQLMENPEDVKKLLTNQTMEDGGELDSLVSESSYGGESLPYTFSITNTGTTPASASISPVSVMAKGGEVKWKKNIGDEGWSYNMENENAYENVGGYISESGNWKIYKANIEPTEFAFKRVGVWSVYRDEELYGDFKTLKEAKDYVNTWIEYNPQDYEKGGDIDKISKFKGELDKLVSDKCSGLECDGTSRIIDYVASLNGVETQPKMGAIIKKQGDDIVDGFEPHFWNEIYIDGDKYIIDYRAQMWLGESAPHGLFKEEEINKENWHYIGDDVNFDRKVSSILYTTRGNDWDELINEYNNLKK